MSPKGGGKASGRRIKALGKAVGKLQKAEDEQDAKDGPQASKRKPVWGPGRNIHNGWRSAKQ